MNFGCEKGKDIRSAVYRGSGGIKSGCGWEKTGLGYFALPMALILEVAHNDKEWKIRKELKNRLEKQ